MKESKFTSTYRFIGLLKYWLRDAPTGLTSNNCTLCLCVLNLSENKQRLVPLTP